MSFSFPEKLGLACCFIGGLALGLGYPWMGMGIFILSLLIGVV